MFYCDSSVSYGPENNLVHTQGTVYICKEIVHYDPRFKKTLILKNALPLSPPRPGPLGGPAPRTPPRPINFNTALLFTDPTEFL